MVTFITSVLGFVCLAAFLFLIDYAARLLRPVSLVKRVSDDGLAVLESVYPEKLTDELSNTVAPQDAGLVARTVLHRGTPASSSRLTCRGSLPGQKRPME